MSPSTDTITRSAKVGIFAIVAIILLVYMTLRVSDLKFTGTGSYSVFIETPNAEGIDFKTPIQIAGIQVGVVGSFELTDRKTARVEMRIQKAVKLPKDLTVELKTRGVLGDVYLEIIPGSSKEVFKEGEVITNVQNPVNLTELAKNLNDVALQLKQISTSINGYVSGKDSVFGNILQNMNRLTGNLANFSGDNRKNLDQIVLNLRDLTRDLKGIARNNSDEISGALERINNITMKIDQGKGSIGKLINDPSTAEGIQDAVEGVNNLLEPVSRLQTEIGYHMEYLGNTKGFKNYASLKLKPRPDKFFIIEAVSDSDPSPTRTITTSQITSGGITNSVTTQEEVIQKNKIRISAQLAKQFRDFTFRGGVIESSGGVGVDYSKGPVGIEFSAFDFTNDKKDRPHLKALAKLNLTQSFYVLGGVDDFISKRHGPDWFFGAGIQLVDEDVKTLIGALSSVKP